MNALAQSYLFWIALILGLLGIYILPSVIAVIRHVEGLGWIIVINLLPTGVGWVAALIAALALPGGRRTARPAGVACRSWSSATYVTKVISVRLVANTDR